MFRRNRLGDFRLGLLQKCAGWPYIGEGPSNSNNNDQEIRRSGPGNTRITHNADSGTAATKARGSGAGLLEPTSPKSGVRKRHRTAHFAFRGHVTDVRVHQRLARDAPARRSQSRLWSNKKYIEALPRHEKPCRNPVTDINRRAAGSCLRPCTPDPATPRRNAPLRSRHRQRQPAGRTTSTIPEEYCSGEETLRPSTVSMVSMTRELIPGWMPPQNLTPNPSRHVRARWPQ